MGARVAFVSSLCISELFGAPSKWQSVVGPGSPLRKQNCQLVGELTSTVPDSPAHTWVMSDEFGDVKDNW